MNGRSKGWLLVKVSTYDLNFSIDIFSSNFGVAVFSGSAFLQLCLSVPKTLMVNSVPVLASSSASAYLIFLI
jgi:hypothetical protein